MEQFDSFCAARRPDGNGLWSGLLAMAVTVRHGPSELVARAPAAETRRARGASAAGGGRARAAEGVCTALEGRVLMAAMGTDQHGIGFGSSRKNAPTQHRGDGED